MKGWFIGLALISKLWCWYTLLYLFSSHGELVVTDVRDSAPIGGDWDIWYMIWYDTLVKIQNSPYQPVYDFLPSTLCLTPEDRMPRLAMGHSLGAKLQAQKMWRHTPWETVDVLFLGWFAWISWSASFFFPLFFSHPTFFTKTTSMVHFTPPLKLSCLRFFGRSCFAASGPIPCFRGWHSWRSITLEWKTRREQTRLQSVDYCRMKFEKKCSKCMSITISIYIYVDIVFS